MEPTQKWQPLQFIKNILPPLKRFKHHIKLKCFKQLLKVFKGSVTTNPNTNQCVSTIQHTIKLIHIYKFLWVELNLQKKKRDTPLHFPTPLCEQCGKTFVCLLVLWQGKKLCCKELDSYVCDKLLIAVCKTLIAFFEDLSK